MTINDLILSLKSVSASPDMGSIVNYIEGWKDDDTTVANLEETVGLLLESLSPDQRTTLESKWQLFKENTIFRLGGMTMNERLYLFGLDTRFEKSEDKLVVYKKLHASP